MKTKLIIQDAISTIGVQFSCKRQDISGREFSLDPAIFLNDCYIDGKSYEINLYSRLLDGRRYYKLPVFLGSLELNYDLPLKKDASGIVVLKDEDAWLPQWPESMGMREFEIRYPESETIISNYHNQSVIGPDGYTTSYLLGQGRALIIVGRFMRRVHFSHRYYLTEDLKIELFDKFMRETKIALETDWGQPEKWADRFIEYAEPLYDKHIFSAKREDLIEFSRMPRLLSSVIEQAYPVKFGADFKQFKRSFFDYLTWRSLSAVMSDSEQAARMPQKRSARGALVEQADLGSDGLAFFKALEDGLGSERFIERVRRLFHDHEHQPLSLVHFINLFGLDAAAEQLLQQWLFMG